MTPWLSPPPTPPLSDKCFCRGRLLWKRTWLFLEAQLQHFWRTHNCLWHYKRNHHRLVSGGTLLQHVESEIQLENVKTLINYILLISLTEHWRRRSFLEWPSICIQKGLNLKCLKKCLHYLQVCDFTLSLSVPAIIFYKLPKMEEHFGPRFTWLGLFTQIKKNTILYFSVHM